MKYIVLIGDGMADRPILELGGKTPLEAARTPNMDFIASHGRVGMVNNVPEGMTPASDVAIMSILGYDPKKYYCGRGPLEAASLNIKLGSDDVAFRCNFVTIEKGKMKSFTAEHIKTKEADKLIKLLNKELGTKDIKFYTGLSYRHITVIKNGPVEAECTPPHDITGQGIRDRWPKGPGSRVLNELMEKSKAILAQPENKTKANMIWLWSQGRAFHGTTFFEKFGLKGSIITAVHLLKGLGKLIGMDVIDVPGATGFIDTNYKGKAECALNSLKKNDIVFVHVEAPDEAGHMGDLKLKIKAIEDFDREVVGRILQGAKKFKEYKIMVLPDHPTPIEIKTHSNEPVPYAIYDSPRGFDNAVSYSERDIGRVITDIKTGHSLLDLLIDKP